MKKFAALLALFATCFATRASATDLPALWGAPVETVGEPIQPTSAAFRLAELKGHAPKGRVGRMDPSAVISPQALAALSQGARVTLPTVSGRALEGEVNLVVREKTGWVRVGGSLVGDRKGSFAFSVSGKGVGGEILLPEESLGYELVLERDGQLLLREKPLSELICAPIPRAPAEPAQAGGGAAPGNQEAPPILSSRPEAEAVLYLDFDGEVVTEPNWNAGQTFTVGPSNLSNIQITSVWQSVKEDFWPFDVDVTTNAARYAAAPVGSRMRVIITPDSDWYGPVGGVARLFSFRSAGQGIVSPTIPCWVFNTSVNGIAEAISHEIGHTLGLMHDGGTVVNARTVGGGDGKEYYIGYSSPLPTWAPIMGAGYDRSMVQWSKGEYDIANNKEDDLAIISGPENGFGYVKDEAGNTIASAPLIGGFNGLADQQGTITANDIDCYRIEAGAGKILLSVVPDPSYPNLDVSAELLNASGAVILSRGANEIGFDATIDRDVAPGTYFLRVRGAGWASAATGGWSPYGSIGYYRVTGFYPNFTPTSPPVITSSATAGGFVGFDFAYQITATNVPGSFSVIGELPPGLSLDSGSGLISGVPTTVGEYPVTVRATNSLGSGTLDLVITIQPAEAFDLGEAVDARELEWTTTGEADWFPQTLIKSDSEDAAQSGPIDHGQSSTLATTVTGPATISFRWKVDSEVRKDFLSFLIGDKVQNRISGKAGWEKRSYNVPAGTHELKWVYAKDYSISMGQDAAWVDTFSVSGPQPPVVTSADSASGMVGVPFSYRITASNSPTSFSVTGTLPAGLSLDSGTGWITGTPAAAGTFELDVHATNSVGTGAGPLTIVIADSDLSIAEAVDAVDRTWTTGGDAVWAGQTGTTSDGVDAASSGSLSGNNSVSWVETTVTGPARLSFRWKVDSELGKDFLRFKIDGANQAAISGDTDWQERTFDIPAGAHALRWSYEKDASIAIGQDAAWLDMVTVGEAPSRVIALSGSLAFGSVEVGDSAERTLTITNTGNAVLTVTGITYPAGFSGNWTGTIAPGESQDVLVTFLPTAASAYAGNVVVASNATDGIGSIAISGNAGAGAGASFFATGMPRAIPDRRAVTTTLEVSGQPAKVNPDQIRLHLSVTHPAVEELVVTLKPPKGPAITVHRRTGGAGDLVISGESLGSGRAINPNGVWKLTINDRKKDQSGVLQTWGLTFP